MLRNHRMMTLKLTRMDVCNILIALTATKEANDGQRWDEVHEKVKLALTEFDKELDIIGRTADMEEMEQNLIELGYIDIAKDVRRLIEYCKSAQIRIGVLFEQLEDVFHDVEWYHSADIGKETLIERLEQYRKGGEG